MLQYTSDFGRSSGFTANERLVNKIFWRKSQMDIIKTIEAESLRQVAQFNIGDTVRVNFKVIEGNKERIQAYEGIVIARKHGGLRETFTVRRISSGIGVERTFPLHSPKIESIAVVRKAANVKRAKLYYLRSRTGKAAKVKGQN